MSAPADEMSQALQLLLSANAHGPVLKAIIEALGEGAIEEFSNAVRLLDKRVGGKLRTIEVIANEDIAELKKKDASNARKQLERIVRGLIRRNASSMAEMQAAKAQQLPWRTVLGAAALDIIRTHGAVDVLQAWLSHRQLSSAAARKKAQKKKADKYSARNKAALAEGDAYAFQPKRQRARTVALHLKRRKKIQMTPEAVRSLARRTKKGSS